MEQRAQWVRKIERLLDVPMMLCALAFFVLFILSLILAPNSPYQPWVQRGIYAIWLLFIFEFAVKLIIAPNRWVFLRKRWVDLLVIVLPFIRLMRVFLVLQKYRILSMLFTAISTGRGVSLFRVLLMLKRGARNLGKFMQLSRLGYVAFVTAVVVFTSAGSVLWFERGHDQATIRTYGDALWWSATVVTTVACELNPVSAGGRIVGVALMVYGVSVFGYFVSYAVAFIQGDRQEKLKIED